ncbi:MAG: MYXO-CTERM sorting domain-containing protein [Polyangiaceae bacterium]
MLGSPDGDTSNDLQTRDGRTLSQPISFTQLYEDYAESWRIQLEDSLFDYGAGEDSNTFVQRSFPGHCPPVSPATQEASEQLCRTLGVSDDSLRRACAFDAANAQSAHVNFADSYAAVPAPKVALEVIDDRNELSPNGASARSASGCGCRVTAGTTGHWGLVGFGLAAVLLRSRRRRAR